jgi:hypothetical protein
MSQEPTHPVSCGGAFYSTLRHKIVEKLVPATSGPVTATRDGSKVMLLESEAIKPLINVDALKPLGAEKQPFAELHPKTCPKPPVKFTIRPGCTPELKGGLNPPLSFYEGLVNKYLQ